MFIISGNLMEIGTRKLDEEIIQLKKSLKKVLFKIYRKIGQKFGKEFSSSTISITPYSTTSK